MSHTEGRGPNYLMEGVERYPLYKSEVDERSEVKRAKHDLLESPSGDDNR